MAKIYTRTGDDGSTGLVGGSRVGKSDPRIDCYGTVDELNAAIGLAASIADPSIRSLLVPIQNELFVVGSILATPSVDDRRAYQIPEITHANTERLEREIDAAEARLRPLSHFILPGGDETAARLHLARTICRRAERLVVQLQADALVVVYLNRLSDWLFVHARLANHLARVEDVPWTK